MESLNKILIDNGIAESMDCTKCKGTGTITYNSLDLPPRDCFYCDKKGKFERPDFDGIVAALKGRKGIRTAKPKDNKRAAYVWRMYRFHAGIDVTLPVMASLDIGGDPYATLLDDLAGVLARKYTGSDTRGAARWARALGLINDY